MSHKWTTLREFLIDLITRMDKGSLTLVETLYIGYLYDLCHIQAEKSEDEEEDEMKRIVTLGMIANYALRENNLSNKQNNA